MATSSEAKTLEFKRGGPSQDRGYFVLAHTTEAPSSQEWQRYMAALALALETARGPLHILVATDGGAPNPGQRKKLAEVFARDRHGALTHVFTTSALVRGIVTAFHWIANARAVAHQPSDFAAVCERLGLLSNEVLQDFLELQLSLGSVQLIRQLENTQRGRLSRRVRSSNRRSQ